MGVTGGEATCLFDVLSILKPYADGKPRPWTYNRFPSFSKKIAKKNKMETDQGRLGRVNQNT
jgi:hypothetical protein